MKTILLMTAALLLATPAWAGGVDCGGTVAWAMEHAGITFTNENGYVDCVVTDKVLAKRFLKVCPIGSKCVIWLGDGPPQLLS
jgi:hypothetical protein